MSDTSSTDMETLRHERFMALLDTFNKHIEHYCVAHSNNRDKADGYNMQKYISFLT